MTDLKQVIVDAVKTHKKADKEFVCNYCERGFRKESTLLAHSCEPKRRAQQEKDAGVQLGLHAYLRFYEISQGSAKLKTYADFCKSAYYKAFTKFGRHMAEENDSVFNHYFLYASTNRIVHHITTGRISAWVIFNSDSGVEMMEKLSAEQIEIIYPSIDPDFWKRKFVDYMGDTEWVKHILKEAGL